MLLLPNSGERARSVGRAPATGWVDAIRHRAPGGWLGVAVGAILLLTLIPGNRGLLRLVGLVRDRAALRAELNTLETRRIGLQDELRRLTSDPATIERLAREKLDFARKGEVVYKLPTGK